MITISLCMIVKNEEKTLGRCLGSVSDLVDEIVIVDTGSTDNTKEIAKSFGAKLYDFKWEDNFSKARNYSFSKGTKDYILWLDGDDYIDEENIEKLMILKEELDKSTDSVMMNYSLVRNEAGKTIYSLRRNRLVKRNKNFNWIGYVHEYLNVFGKIIQSDITINHDKKKVRTNRNLLIFKGMEDKGEVFTTRDIFYYANELYDNNLYYEASEKYKEALNKEDIWFEDSKRATINLVRCLEFLQSPIDERIDFIFNSLKKYSPNSEMLCLLGECFVSKNIINEGIIYFKGALDLDEGKDNLGFNNNIYSTWVPAIELCVCYSLIGDIEKSYYYNELADLYSAPKEKIEYNRKFLKNQMKEKNIKERSVKRILTWDI